MDTKLNALVKTYLQVECSMSKKNKKGTKKQQLTNYPIRDYPENSRIWYGSQPHHYKYPHE